MDSQEWLAVTNSQALRFFFEHLRDVTEGGDIPQSELLYNASVLAHFATTSTASVPQFPSCPSDLATVFEVFVLDRSQHTDPEIMEAAAAQCLLLTGFFEGQVRRRHNVKWYATLGAQLLRSGRALHDRSRARTHDAHDGRAVRVLAAPAGAAREGAARSAQVAVPQRAGRPSGALSVFEKHVARCWPQPRARAPSAEQTVRRAAANSACSLLHASRKRISRPLN